MRTNSSPAASFSGNDPQARLLAASAVTIERVVYAGGDDGILRAIDPAPDDVIADDPPQKPTREQPGTH